MSFEELQSVATRAVKPEDVVDIQQIKIDDGLSQQEKRREFIRQVKNPIVSVWGRSLSRQATAERGFLK